MDYLYLIVGLAFIFLAAELFTNAVEWFGKRLNLSEGAVGSVLAAVGTALPETSIPLVAFVVGGEGSEETGIGAILGAPMMLSTLAMFVTGFAIITFARRKLRKPIVNANHVVVGRDLRSFFLVYILALVAALIAWRGAKIAIGLSLLGIYAFYVYRTFQCPECDDEGGHLRPLHFSRSVSTPRLRMVLVQLASGLGLMLVGAKLFVDNVQLVATALGASTLVLSVIITPIATELPEKFNSITWVRHRKDTLALGNITGAMVFQSSVLPAIGIFMTPWHLEPRAIASIVVALIASSVLWVEMTVRKRLSPYSLMLGGLIYLIYPLVVFGWLGGK